MPLYPDKKDLFFIPEGINFYDFLTEERRKKNLCSAELGKILGYSSSYLSVINKLKGKFKESVVKELIDVLKINCDSDLICYRANTIPQNIHDFILKNGELLHPFFKTFIEQEDKSYDFFREKYNKMNC